MDKAKRVAQLVLADKFDQAKWQYEEWTQGKWLSNTADMISVVNAGEYERAKSIASDLIQRDNFGNCCRA